MDTHALVPDVTDADLPLACRACALVRADLRLAPAGLRLGTARGLSMGCVTLGRDLRRREDCLPHFAFRRLLGLSLQWRPPGRFLHRGQSPDETLNRNDSGNLLDH